LHDKTTHLAAPGTGEIQGLTEDTACQPEDIQTAASPLNGLYPFIARGVRAEGPGDSIAGLDTTALGISFIEVADPYQSVSQSLKLRIALPGIGLPFLLHL
jgi:inner membrane protein